MYKNYEDFLTKWQDEDIKQELSMSKNKKPVQIYFRSPASTDVTKVDPNVVAEYNKILPVDVVTCDSWDELNALLLQKPNQISIHANVFMLSDLTTISETIKMLQTKLKIIELDIPIAIVVERTTNKNIVLKTKELGVQGLIPYHGDWDNVDIIQGLDALTNRILHWPEHIINQLPTTIDKPISVYFRKDAKEYFEYVNDTYYNSQLVLTFPWQFRACDSWNELSEILKETPHQLIFHVDMLNQNGTTLFEFVSMIETLMKLVMGKTIPIAIAIDKTTPLSLVKEFNKNNIHGIVPSMTSFGKDETYKGIEALTNRIPYYPKHILDQLPGAKKTVVKNTIKLTSRQAQIVNLISERGLTNKKIAQALNITESTVKIHVSAILKAYGVRTRTQLALAAIK